jgi:hypothetical protein
MSNLLTNNLFDVMNEVQDLQRVETPGACLTLTRSATLAITTAGTTITWQVETRNNGFTWSGTEITIPTNGYYTINLQYNAAVVTTTFAGLRVNGIAVAFFSNSSVNSTLHSFTVMRYFTADDLIEMRVFPAANSTIQVIAENVASESPILHVVQMTGSLT